MRIPMISIVDYGSGNILSVQNMLTHAGHASKVVTSAEALEDAVKIILPGVGSFDFGMESLENLGMVDILDRKALADGIPVLGICLGAQLLTRGSEEGELPGLGWLPADTIAFDPSTMDSHLKIPHMGWADTLFRKKSELTRGGTEQPRYYYAHSYHMRCDSPDDVLCEARHGNTFTAGVEKGNITGLQFHPEKSHKFGLQLLKNFAECY